MGTGKEKCKTYEDMQMNQNSRGRKFFEQLWRKLEKNKSQKMKVRQILSQLFKRKKKKSLKGSLCHRLASGSSRRKSGNSLWTPAASPPTLPAPLYSDQVFAATCTRRDVSGLHSLLHAVPSPWNGMSFLSFYLFLQTQLRNDLLQEGFLNPPAPPQHSRSTWPVCLSQYG